jgi:hypothetical protein
LETRAVARITRCAHLMGHGDAVAADAESSASPTPTRGASRRSKLTQVHPALANYLAGTVKRGYLCVYRPDPRRPIVWRQ